MLIKPRKLAPGDTLAAVTLSWGGPGAFPDRYAAGKHQLEQEFGVRVVEMPNALRDPQFIADNPRARADDLMQAFTDPQIQGVVATIGGDDSIRLLRHLDLDVLRRSPKVFLGYSDTTVTHFACMAAGLGSFYGPSVMAGFGESGGLFRYMVDSVRRTLFSSAPLGIVAPNLGGWTVEHSDWSDPESQQRPRALQPSSGWRFLQGEGRREGRLIGGCVEVLDWLRGTALWPELESWRDAILFIETSEDAPPPDSVARFLRVLAAMGVLQRLAGVLYGRPGGCVPLETFDDYDRALLRVIAEEEGLTALPIVTRMDFGHTDPMFVLPYGALARIDCEARSFAILEPAVVER